MFYEFKHSAHSDYSVKEYGKNFIFQAHLHRAFEFITVFSGEMHIMVDGTPFTIKKGEGILIFPNQIHSLDGNGSRHMLLIFAPDIVKAYASKVLDKMPADNSFTPSNSLIAAIDNLPEDATLIEKKGLLYSLCAEFDKCATYGEKVAYDKNLLYIIFKFVEEKLGGDCSLKALSEETGFSYFYLSRYFKKTVGISYNEYVNQCKISSACHLMTNPDYSILDCALESGYDSLRSFNRNFIATMGMTPSEYRKGLLR